MRAQGAGGLPELLALGLPGVGMAGTGMAGAGLSIAGLTGAGMPGPGLSGMGMPGVGAYSGPAQPSKEAFLGPVQAARTMKPPGRGARGGKENRMGGVGEVKGESKAWTPLNPPMQPMQPWVRGAWA